MRRKKLLLNKSFICTNDIAIAILDFYLLIPLVIVPPQISITKVVALNHFFFCIVFLQNCFKASLLHCLLFSVILRPLQDVPKLYSVHASAPQYHQTKVISVPNDACYKNYQSSSHKKKDRLFKNKYDQILIICCLKKLINSIYFT